MVAVQKSRFITVLAITFLLLTVGFVGYFIYFWATVGFFTVETISLVSCWYLLASIVMIAIYVRGRKKLRPIPEELAEFKSTFRNLILGLGLPYVIYMGVALWDLLKGPSQ